MYDLKDLVKFKINDLIIAGEIKGINENEYTILGNNAKGYSINGKDIIAKIGSVYTNKNRSLAEDWQKDKSKGIDYDNAKNWENTKEELKKF